MICNDPHEDSRFTFQYQSEINYSSLSFFLILIWEAFSDYFDFVEIFA